MEPSKVIQLQKRDADQTSRIVRSPVRVHPYSPTRPKTVVDSDPQPLNFSVKDKNNDLNNMPPKMRFKQLSANPSEKECDNSDKQQEQSPAPGKIRVKNLKELVAKKAPSPRPIPRPIERSIQPAKKTVQKVARATAVQNNNEAKPNVIGPEALKNIYLSIVEQPSSNGLRFRYQCEGRSAGSMYGQSSTSGAKTHPKVAIHGYKGPAKVAVSCVENDPPFRCHPHNLVGKNCNKGVYVVRVDESDMTATICNIGIQCVKKKDMGDSLMTRKQIGIDPFRQGFNYREGTVNPNMIRLCFQAFLFPPGRTPIVLEPKVSQTVHDKKAFCDLTIVDISDTWSPVEGGKKILLMSKKINKADIEVHITFTHPQTLVHETVKGKFNPSDVHEQCGISMRTPPFPDKTIKKRVECQLFLYKPSDFNQSDPVNFYYYPSHEFPESEPDTIAEEDAEQESADSGYVEDQQPDEDYDNYDSERTLQIVEEDNEGGASSGDKSDQAKSKVSKNRLDLPPRKSADNVAKVIIKPRFALPFKDAVNSLDIPYSVLYPETSLTEEMQTDKTESSLKKSKKTKDAIVVNLAKDIDEMDIETLN